MSTSTIGLYEKFHMTAINSYQILCLFDRVRLDILVTDFAGVFHNVFDRKEKLQPVILKCEKMSFSRIVR